jgi:hypothetical protein
MYFVFGVQRYSYRHLLHGTDFREFAVPSKLPICESLGGKIGFAVKWQSKVVKQSKFGSKVQMCESIAGKID